MRTNILLLLFFFVCSCSNSPKEKEIKISNADTLVIIDCQYTFEQAISGTKAPKNIIDQLTLFDVQYYSLDGKLHQGQILTNKTIAKDIKVMFQIIKKEHFPIAHAIPIVKYGWNDKLSMQNNNTYSFCYRNVSFSMHAYGLAIDINPYFNPVRWKKEYCRKSQPEGAIYNPNRPGTFTPECIIVKEFLKRKFHWGRTMTQKSDDHHFEKAGYYEKFHPHTKDSTQSSIDSVQPNKNEFEDSTKLVS